MPSDPRDPNLPPAAQPQPSQPSPQPYGYPAQPQQPQSPYGYPGAAQGQAYGQPYQAPQPYQATQPYQTPQPYQGYAAAGYPSSGYATATPTGRKSPLLGILGFGVVVVTAIIAVLIGLGMAEPMSQVIALAPPGSTEIDVESIPPGLMDQLTAPLGWLTLAGLVGTGGWIASIVAAISNRGRGWGVAGIILGILAPIAALIAMSVAAVAAVS